MLQCEGGAMVQGSFLNKMVAYRVRKKCEVKKKIQSSLFWLMTHTQIRHQDGGHSLFFILFFQAKGTHKHPRKKMWVCLNPAPVTSKSCYYDSNGGHSISPRQPGWLVVASSHGVMIPDVVCSGAGSATCYDTGQLLIEHSSHQIKHLTPDKSAWCKFFKSPQVKVVAFKH